MRAIASRSNPTTRGNDLLGGQRRELDDLGL